MVNDSLRVDLRLRPTKRGSLRVRCTVVTVLPATIGPECAHHAAQMLRSAGCVRIDGLLPQQIAADLLSHCDALLDKSLLAVRAGALSPAEVLAPHLLSGTQYGKRHDLMLELAPPVLAALRVALRPIASALAMLVGADAELFELSSVVSTDGTPAQPMHVDFPKSQCAATEEHGERIDRRPPTAIVAFVALHQLSAAMGPTNFAVGTHCADFERAVEAAWSPAIGSATAVCVSGLGCACTSSNRIALG